MSSFKKDKDCKCIALNKPIHQTSKQAARKKQTQQLDVLNTLDYFATFVEDLPRR
jgi:hypothetical protein